MKFMEVLMNVYLRYSFNCWRKWLYILRKRTAKGVLISVYSVPNKCSGARTTRHLNKASFFLSFFKPNVSLENITCLGHIVSSGIVVFFFQLCSFLVRLFYYLLHEKEWTGTVVTWYLTSCALFLVDIHSFWWKSVCKLSLTRERKFDVISQSGWITLTSAQRKRQPANFKKSR